MATLTEDQLHLLFYYEWLSGSSASEATAKINAAFKEDVATYRTVHRWFTRFESGDTRLESKHSSGRPTTVDDNALLLAIKDKPEATTRELATTLGCSHSTVESHLNSFGYHKVLSRWVPHQLTEGQRIVRTTICQSNLLRPNRKDFLQDLVTGDESWILYNNNTRHAVWIQRGEEPPTQPKADLHPTKILLCCFWDARGMLYFDLLPQGKTVNATLYSTQLENLAAAIREKRRRRANVYLLHDNARPHTAKDTHSKLAELNWEIVPHPPYSPDLAPSDYHLFRHLKSFLRSKTFVDFGHLKTDVSNFFDSQPSSFWEKGINDLPNRWATVVGNDGFYIVD